MNKNNNVSADLLVLDGSVLKNPTPDLNIPKQFKKELDESNSLRVVLDLTALEKVYSYAIALSVGLSKECSKRNREFSIKVSNEDIFSLFKMLKLEKLLNVQMGKKEI